MSKLLWIALGLTLAATLANQASAKIVGPQPVAPVIHDGVKYVAPHNNGRQGRIEARDATTNKKLWDVVIYTVKIDPNLEEDVQWVFITGLALKDNTLIITNAKNEEYTLDLKTKKVERVAKDAPKTN